SLSDGFSQVIAITAQICSGVYVAGAPERGASASRSDTDWAAGACRHRPRQYRTVFGHTSSSRALSRTPILSAHAKSCKPATPSVVRLNGLAPALPGLAPPIRLLFCCRKAASLILPSYLHARRSRNFRSAVLGKPQFNQVTTAHPLGGWRRQMLL